MILHGGSLDLVLACERFQEKGDENLLSSQNLSQGF